MIPQSRPGRRDFPIPTRVKNLANLLIGAIYSLKGNKLVVNAGTQDARTEPEFPNQCLAVGVDSDLVIPNLGLNLPVGTSIDPEGIGEQGLNEFLRNVADEWHASRLRG